MQPRGAQVAPLGQDAWQPALEIGTLEAGAPFSCECGEVIEMAAGHVGRGAGCVESFAGEGPDRVEHPEAGLGCVGRPRRDEGVVDQTREGVEDVESVAAHRVGLVECEATFEHGETSEEALFVDRQQAVAPPDRGVQRGHRRSQRDRR